MVSFLEAFGNEPWVAGVLIWKWRDHPGAVGGPKDSGYTPFKKPVLEDIKRYFNPSEDPSASAGATTREAAPSVPRTAPAHEGGVGETSIGPADDH